MQSWCSVESENRVLQNPKVQNLISPIKIAFAWCIPDPLNHETITIFVCN